MTYDPITRTGTDLETSFTMQELAMINNRDDHQWIPMRCLIPLVDRVCQQQQVLTMRDVDYVYFRSNSSEAICKIQLEALKHRDETPRHQLAMLALAKFFDPNCMAWLNDYLEAKNSARH